MSSDDEEDRTVQELAPVRGGAASPRGPAAAVARDEETLGGPRDDSDSTEGSTIERGPPLASVRIKTPGYGEIVPREAASLPKRPSVKIEKVEVVKAEAAAAPPPPPPAAPEPKRRESTAMRAAHRAPLHTVLGLAPSGAQATDEPEPPSAPDLPTQSLPRAELVAAASEADIQDDSVTALNASPRPPSRASIHERAAQALPLPPEPDSEDSITAQSITQKKQPVAAPTSASRASASDEATLDPTGEAPSVEGLDEDELTTKGPLPVLPGDEPEDSITTRAPRLEEMREPLVSLAERAIASVPRQVVAAHPAAEEMDSVVSVTAQMPGHMADALRIAVTESSKGPAAQALRGAPAPAPASDVPRPLPARRAPTDDGASPSSRAPTPSRPPMPSRPPPLPPKPEPRSEAPPPSSHARGVPPPSADPRSNPPRVSATPPPTSVSMPASASAIPVLPPLMPDGDPLAFEQPPRFDPPSQAALRGDVQLPSIQQAPPSWSSLPQGVDTSEGPVSQGRWVALVAAVAVVSVLVPTLLFFYLRRGSADDAATTAPGGSTAASALHAPARLGAAPDELDDSDPRTKKLRAKPKKKK